MKKPLTPPTPPLSPLPQFSPLSPLPQLPQSPQSPQLPQSPPLPPLPHLTPLLNRLDELYPWEDKCFLHYEQPWQLLVATILSAQCTDDRVNLVTKELFAKYPTLAALAEADIHVLEEDVRATGFFRMKALHIKQSATRLLACHDGQLPSDITTLTALPGVGRKTANVVRGHIFHIPSIVVDTHVKRITYKLGLTKNTEPEKIEQDLMALLPKDHWIRFNQQIITHGRQVCTARAPRCDGCGLFAYCAWPKRQR